MVAEKQAKLYKGIADLPFTVFLRCLLDSDLSALVVEGYPTAEEVNECWLHIVSEYTQAIQDTRFTDTVRKAARIELINSRITVVEGVIKILEQRPPQDIVDQLLPILKQERIRDMEFDLKNPVRYEYCLQNALAQLGSDKDAALNETRQIEAMRLADDKKPTRQRYVDTFAEISKYMGFRVSINDNGLMTDEFCSYYRNLMEHYRQQEAQIRANERNAR